MTEPFTEASEAAMFRRPSWGPDGRHLCCPTAVKAGAHIASVLTRGTWSPDVDFVGHVSIAASALAMGTRSSLAADACADNARRVCEVQP